MTGSTIESAAPDASRPTLAVNGSAVLVVDDDAGARGLVAFALSRAGFRVLEAMSGEAAFEVVRAEPVGLIVLDMSMPGMSGTDVVRRLRATAETATLPILLMTGSGDSDSVIRGLEAGADDFVPKPVRLDELVARVNANLRTQAAWSHVVEDELQRRARVVAALGHLTISSVPEEAAEAVVRELSESTESDFVAVLQLGSDDRLQELATYDRATGVRRGGHTLSAAHARRVLERAREGPWVKEVDPPDANGTGSFPSATPELAAGAPIYAGDELVGILTIGLMDDARRSPQARQAKLLAAAIDYASVLSTRAGSAFADRRDVAATQARLRNLLVGHEYHPAFQPIVNLATREVIGFEALTRFDDGSAPDVRFGEADRSGLGPEYELATLRAALAVGADLPAGAFLSLNVSPAFVLRGSRRFRQLIADSPRPLVLELTEHVAIDDYPRVRAALAKLGDVGLAVDDAGAGYASLRHILELRPTFAKLDISLVRGIDGDDLRQALAAGLQFFASRTGCRLIAEGIETDAEADVLHGLGIELGQGFLFGRPGLVPSVAEVA